MALGFITFVVIVILGLLTLVWGGKSIEKGDKVKTYIAATLILILVASLVLVPFSFKTVQTGEIAVVKHLGKAVKTRDAGTHFDLWLTNKYIKYDTKVRELTIKDMAYSSDAQQMTLNIKFQYQIMSNKVMEITSSYGDTKALEARIQAIVVEKTKSALSGYTAMDIIANRATLSPQVEDIVKKALGDEYFVNVTSIAITNIDFSDAFETAVEDKMIAEQKQLKAKYEADAKIVSAEADAKSKIVTAEAEAEANRLLETSLTDKILQEMYLNKWDGKLPQVVSDGNMMYQIPNIQ